MDKQKAKILHDLLKSSSADKTCRGLREIKKRLLTSPENLSVFRTLGLIPQALKLIQRPNEEILNGALSILSSCCTDEGARSEVFSEGGITHMVNVLKCAKLEPLQLRACRTLANQAQHKPSCEMLVRLKAVELVIEVLEGCQEEDTKVAGIRALRLFANCGEHCQKIVTCKGILRICSAGFGSVAGSAGPNLVRATVKAIAHFSRISHPACVSQIMEGTDNMILMSKMWDTTDQEIYECVLRTILNTVHSCFVPTPHKRDALDAKVLDRLCTATAPSIIVAELQNRRVTAIEEEKLILALCKFCEGSNECNNLTFGSFSEPPTFLGRAWMQLIDCGGVAMLVSLLLAHRSHPKLRPALLRAILGVEHNYSYRDTILKHLLAAKLLPQLAEQFDELMTKYIEVRRDSLPGKCIHTMLTGDEETVAGGGESNGSEEKGREEMEMAQKGLDSQVNKMEVEKEEENKHGRTKQDTHHDSKKTSVASLCLKDTRTTPKDSGPGGSHSNSSSASPETTSSSNHRSPLPASYLNPKSPGSVSCSPRSHQSSEQGSPSWSPPAARSESPTITSPPFVSMASVHTSPLPSLPPWSVEAAHTSPTASPPHSPRIHSPLIGSPLRSTSPIRVPSDWEYEDEEEKEMDDDGRFSPTVLESKLSELEESQEELEEEEEEEEEERMSMEEEAETGVPKEKDKDESDIQKAGKNVENLTLEGSTESPLSPNTGKRGRDSPPTRTQEKKVKLSEETDGTDGAEGSDAADTSSTRQSPPLREAGRSEVEIGGKDGKSPFVNLNQIKFRVRKKGQTRRQLSLREVYTPLQDQSVTEPKTGGRQKHQQQQQQQQQEQHQGQQQQQGQSGRGRSDSICSSTVYSDLSQEEAQSLELLELVVRVIGQVAHVKEAIKPVCREFVPRIMTYLSKVQVIHKSATRMLVTIARNTQSIQPLLDSLFIPYVGVELGEAGDPESPNGCSQCKILSEGSSAFLDQMVNFFNHIHQYGQCEVSSRLHPSRELAVREGCAMALPHITRCPKLLHDFMVCYPAIDLLMNVLHSSQPPDQASYMYATAALSRLASALQLENQFRPVRCEVCYRRESHTKEEVTAQLKNKNMRCGQTHPAHSATHTHTPASSLNETMDCQWLKDKEEKDVTFRLEDGSTVSANRESLADKNEFLRGMLLGSFSEGLSSSIDLPWTSKESTEMLIHFLHGCRRCIHMESGGMEAYMELVLMSEMYLVEELQVYAESRMISAINAWEDIIRIYESGVGRINENIILWAICTVLVKPMKTWKRARWIKGLFQSPHAKDIDHNIRMILRHPLDMNRLVCNCNQSLSLYMVSESEYTKLC
ncbi:hypothetical protein O3P69_004778 [Scylla paramamosain]|uniref:BTB domain-containing protein n=1 Tax=Scylla paramamosain TaxID=85552 RepID=A0AAW0UCW9_SCYPA